VPDDRVTITPYRDGPLLVRGPVRIVDEQGNGIDPGRTTVALCRCGRSQLKPLCDGTHRVCGFRAPISATTAPPATRP
jgi:CDGSH-type Zn-finger protein